MALIRLRENFPILELRVVADSKIVYDTSFYIAFLRSKSFAQSIRSRYDADIPFTLFSSVVEQELLAGATDQLKLAAVKGLYRPFERSRRIVTPSYGVWQEAGRLLGVMRRTRRDLVDRLAGSFVNDILIALSARSVGARVVTFNTGDFRMIANYVPLTIEVLQSQR